jgi:hypothetical protein
MWPGKTFIEFSTQRFENCVDNITMKHKIQLWWEDWTGLYSTCEDPMAISQVNPEQILQFLQDKRLSVRARKVLYRAAGEFSKEGGLTVPAHRLMALRVGNLLNTQGCGIHTAEEIAEALKEHFGITI